MPTIRAMTSTAGALYIVGATIEAGGIILVGSPDLFPQAGRSSEWLRKHSRRLANRIRRLLRRPQSQTVYVDAAAGAIALGGSATASKSVSAGATSEEKIAFLLQRDQEAQRDVSALAQRLAALDSESSQRLRELRSEVDAAFARDLKAALERYLPLRLVGAAALVIGLACATAGNFAN
jgi:hypothetical protein